MRKLSDKTGWCDTHGLRLARLAGVLGWMLAAVTGPATALQLDRLFSDHMVLQRGQPIRVSGRAQVGTSVSVQMGVDGGLAHADAEGRWTVVLPARPAGGPLELQVRNETETVVVRDVLVGDVWLASGQSNMAYRIEEGVTDAGPDLTEGAVAGIRHFVIAMHPAEEPQQDLHSGTWRVASPESIPGFSAVAHTFARALHDRTGVPIGVIEAAVGGSPIEAWMSPQALEGLPHMAGPPVEVAAHGCSSLAEFHAVNEANVATILKRVTDVEAGSALGVHGMDFADAAWHESAVPRWMQGRAAVHWMRRWIGWDGPTDAPAMISLGVPSSHCHVFLNGVLVHAATVSGPCRIALPARALVPGMNLIAVRLANPWFPPYFEGEGSEFFVSAEDGGRTVPLENGWRISDAVEPPLPPYVKLQEIPSALYHGMIHPVLGFGFAGFLWYQGENNADRADEYRALFPALINDWRRAAGRDAPFIFVQLAGFGNPTIEVEPAQGWPWLREAQARALDLPNTAMAVALDLGDTYDIHPKRKRAVGDRLARCALAMVYGVSTPSRGPVVDDVVFDGETVRISWMHAEGLHTSDGSQPRGFALAGADLVFHPAHAAIRGSFVDVTSEAVPAPVAVRYGWAKHPVVSLFNAAGLPAEPFRSDRWPPSPASR